MIGDFLKAIGQLGDARFLKVLGIGIALTVGLLFVVTALLVTVVGWFALSWAIVPLMLVLSVFLMVPVASAFTSIFLDDVADAVEARYYPTLPQAPRVGFWEGLSDSLRFLGVIVAANIAAFALYLLFPPAAPLIFLALNGYLLGREYFTLVAIRRLGREGARAARSRNGAQIWVAGILMAVPLAIPVVNLFVPVLGAATFTHLFHRVTRT